MAIYEIYIDIYFIENLMLDMLVLLSVSLLLGKMPALWRFAHIFRLRRMRESTNAWIWALKKEAL